MAVSRIVLTVHLKQAGAQADNAASADSSQEAADTATLEVTFKEQDARQLAIRMRSFQPDGMQVRILAPDSRTWVVSGTASDVRTIKHLAEVLDRTILTPEHVVRTYDIEHQDARLLAVSSRSTAPKGASWGIVVSPEGRWHVILPQDELVAFEAWLDEIDSPS
jgi:type II secretory pathway component GspD/PulD (secretin)